MKNCLAWCSIAFSVSSLIVKTTSVLSHSSTFQEPRPCFPILQLSKSLGYFSWCWLSTKVCICFPLPHFSQPCTIKLAPHIQHLSEVSCPALVLFSWCAARFSTLITEMATTLVGTLPLLPNCISLMHFHTFFPPKTLSFCLLYLGSEPAILCFSGGLPCFIPGYFKSRQLLFLSWSQPSVICIISPL